jgi:hypothetical protein
VILVDTCIFSLALRRRRASLSRAELRLVGELTSFIRASRASLLGIVRQELLSGIRDAAQFERLRAGLRAFPDPALEIEDFEMAAQVTNRCHKAGVAGSVTDFLICGVSLRRDWAIFTTDKDFHSYARHLPLRLVQPA